MKVFGKKTLALVLTIAMALSLCSFTAFAAVEKVELDETTLSLEVGETATLNATVTPGDSTDVVTWSSGSDVATVAPPSGNSTTVTAAKAGSTIITATCGDKTATCTVNVSEKPVAVTGVSITTKKDVMVIGQQFKFAAKVEPDTATNKNVSWESSNKDVATVGEDGTVKAIGAGQTNIMAVTEDQNKTDFVTVTVVEKKIYSVTTTSKSLNIGYGKDESHVKSELAKIEWNVLYGEEGKTVEGKATLSAEQWRCSTEGGFQTKKKGDFTFTASFDADKTVTVTVTVGQGLVESVPSLSYTVYKGTAKDTVIAKTLPSKVEVTLVGGAKETFTVGTTGDFHWECTNYDATTPSTYNFTAVANSNAAATEHFANVNMNGKTITAQVTVSAAYSLPISETLYYNKSTTTSIDLEKTIKAAVNEAVKTRLGVTTTTVTYKNMVSLACTNNTYGKLGTGSYTYTADSSKFVTTRTMTETFTYSAVDTDGVTYSGTLTLSIVSNTFDVADKTSTSDPIVYFKGSNGIAQKIEDAFKARYGSAPAYIDFGNIGRNDDDLGELRDANADNAENGTYSFSSNDSEYPSVSGIYFIPTGKSGEFDVEYTAYSGSGSSQKTMTGTITITCEEMLVVWLNNLSAGETQNLSSSAIQDQVTEIVDTSRISYTLDTVILSKPSTGTLYDDSNKKITGTTKAIDADNLDDYTYEAPAKVTSNTLVTIKFSAKCQPDTGKNSKTVYGVMLFNLAQKADITITAAKNQEVTIDPDLFQDYLDEVTKSTKYDVAYVIISGAPRSKTDGYLYADGEKLTKSGDKTFYADPGKNEYGLDNLTFMGGSSNGTVSGTFKVYYYKTASAKNPTATSEGTIDFVTGAASTNSLSGSIKASETMKFAASLSAFEDLGGNDNVYVTFTGLPNGGKLVYNWGTGSQEDVKVGTEYYLSYKAGKKLLSNVTFVPSYSSSKQARTISIPVKAYNSKEKAVTGTINITVNYAAYSSKFTDITTSTYADSVDFLYNQGITTGMTTTTFGPNSNVTRAQFVTFLYRAAGQPAVTGVTNKFTDVKSTGTYAYAYNAILWAVQNNITTGRSATKFDPAANVTHQELLTFLYRYDVNYLGHPGTQGSLSGFIDASSLQSYAVAPAKWASYKGIIDGYTLQPAVAGSRATVALWLHRMLTL